MLSDDRTEQTEQAGYLADAPSACVALVPVVQRAQWSQIPTLLSRSDSTFIVHLIATAEHIPQTRGVRRATAADAQTAYGSRQTQVQSASVRTRQII